MPESIQDWLVQQGYAIDEENGFFRKYSLTGDLTKIPFSAIIGQSLGSFKTRAVKEGWAIDNEPKPNAEMATALQQLQKAWGYTGPVISVDMTKANSSAYHDRLKSLHEELKLHIFEGETREWPKLAGESK